MNGAGEGRMSADDAELERYADEAREEAPKTARYVSEFGRRNREATERFATRTGQLLAVLVLCQVATGAWSVKLTAEGNRQQDRLAETQGRLVRAQGQLTTLELQTRAERRRSIVTACHESNRRHVESLPLVENLVAGSTTAPQPGELEALRALRTHRQPHTSEGRRAYRQTRTFLQLLAPAYDCKKRLAQLTK